VDGSVIPRFAVRNQSASKLARASIHRKSGSKLPHPRLDICEAAGGRFFVRLKAHLVREVEVLFRHALSGL